MTSYIIINNPSETESKHCYATFLFNNVFFFLLHETVIKTHNYEMDTFGYAVIMLFFSNGL